MFGGGALLLAFAWSRPSAPVAGALPPGFDDEIDFAPTTATLIEELETDDTQPQRPAVVVQQGAPSEALSVSRVGAVSGRGSAGATSSRPVAPNTRLVWPAQGPVTSHYGVTHPLGIDIGQWEGPILAATAGRVIAAGGDPCCSYGLYVVIEGAGGVTTLYGHLSSIAVREGETVRQGQAIGVVGCTGRCFGPHLHFELLRNGVRQDPLAYLP
jgi:murein DD-endopeptidase MepM/ murein hydrolase activator NlpD